MENKIMMTYELSNVYANMLDIAYNSIPDNDWFHPSGTPCKRIRKGTKNHKKKSKK